MKGKQYSICPKAIVRAPSGQCLVIRRSACSGHDDGLWEFPGGKLDPGENVENALVREIEEETGLNVRLIKVLGAAEKELSDVKVAYLFFEAVAASMHVRLSKEHDAFKWVDPCELSSMHLCPQFQAMAREFASRGDETITQ